MQEGGEGEEVSRAADEGAVSDPYDLGKDAGRRRRALGFGAGRRPVHPAEVANADLAADLRAAIAERGTLAALVAELLESGPLSLETRREGLPGEWKRCKSCGEADPRHLGDCWRERARKALEGRSDGE